VSTVDVTGHSPLSFTDANGAQRNVPLSALEFVGSDVKLKTAWAAEFSAGEQTTLLALATALAAGGQLVPPPVAAPMPAIGFAAATPGTEGNNIVVTVTPDAGPVLEAQIKITAREIDNYTGLGDATAAAMAIGVDAPTGTPGDPGQGGGLVMVKQSAALGTGLPKDAQSLTVKNATPVLAADGTSTLFTLVPRAGAPGAGMPVKVAVDSGTSTFSVQASFDTGTQPKVAMTDLGSLAAPVKFLVTASAPPSGLASPAAGDVQLSGGASGIAATGVAYTS
jgi:hypothetical protein